MQSPLLLRAKTMNHDARNICYGRMFPTCFLILPHMNMFLPSSTNIFCCYKQCSRVAKLGNIVEKETCVRSKCFWQHVSSFCQDIKVLGNSADVPIRVTRFKARKTINYFLFSCDVCGTPNFRASK